MLSSLSSSTTSLTTNNSDIAETYFGDIKTKVDRNVLEVMLNGGDSTLPSADNFFVTVSNQSGAIVSFPQKQKLQIIGRKEPEIRILGTPAQIQLARAMIMEILDPHQNRVTLKIDVSHTDHSHVIGKGGKRIQSVMNLTDCHIHFPDGNRTNAKEKSNQVTIAGTSLRQAEEARLMIRQYLPLTISFQLEVNGGNISLLDASHPNIQYYQNRYGVIISFQFSTQSTLNSLATIYVRGTRMQFEDLREATRALYQYLNWSEIGYNNTVITINVEIAPQHHLFVMGRSNCNVKAINDHTGAVVSFPDIEANSSSLADSVQKSTVAVRGKGIESAFMAWLELLGYLPMVMIFDLKPDQAIDGHLMTSLMANQLLSIVIRPKFRTNMKSIVVKTQERHSNLLFEARQQILNMKELQKVSSISSFSTCSPRNRLPSGFPSFPFNMMDEPEVIRAVKEFFDNFYRK